MAEVQFVFWDVQHGSAAYINTPGGQHIAIDLGTGSVGASNEAFSPLRHLRDRYGVRQLDQVIISHPHRDHLDDIFEFDAMSPRCLSRPKHLTEADIRGGNQAKDTPIIDKYLEINRRYNRTLEPGESSLDAGNNGGAEFETFTPTTPPRLNLNNHSMVTVVSYAGSKILIPGDNEAASWNELLGRADFRSAIRGTDILVAAHHGRASGFSESLFEYISPRLTIVSDGPVGGTSITGTYSQRSRGWKVFSRRGGSEVRKCLTTRSDGVVIVRFGTEASGTNYMNVTIE